MPWTASDASKHIKGLTAHQQEVWAAVANRVLASGGSDADAIKQANAAAKRAPDVKVSEADIAEHGDKSKPNYYVKYHPEHINELAQPAYSRFGGTASASARVIPDDAWGDINHSILSDEYLDGVESTLEGFDLGDRMHAVVIEDGNYTDYTGTIIGFDGEYRKPTGFFVQAGKDVHHIDAAGIVAVDPLPTPDSGGTIPGLATAYARGLLPGGGPNWDRVDPAEAQRVGLTMSESLTPASTEAWLSDRLSGGSV